MPAPSIFRSSMLWLISAFAAVLPWLLDAAGLGLPRRLSQVLVVLALGGLAAAAGAIGGRVWRREWAASRPGAVALALLVGLAVAVHFAGLSFEVGHGYYRDEGIYRAAAERINAGALLPQSFIYGHLPYYMAAWSLWLHGLFFAPSTALVRALTGLGDEAAVSWMWIRLWSGLCGALTVLPVFGMARRVVAGTAAPPPRVATFAGLVAGLAITSSTLYNEVTHVFISDVPAAFFAALCLYFVARLTERETLSDYAWAGFASGLAAACKYPAGVVAVGIVAVWVWWRLPRSAGDAAAGRSAARGLLLAGAVSLATFLLVMPSFLVHPRAAFAGQGRDVLFGVRQYADASWIGVEKDSNASWYAAKTWETFGAGALVLGLLGVAGLPRAARRRWLLLAVFPLLYGLLLVAMAMVVKRNLLPFLPPAAALLGAGAAGAAWWIARRWPRAAPLAAAGVAVAALAMPWTAVVAQDLSLVRPGTREVLADWVRRNLPPGAGIVKESYTPRLDGPFDVLQTRFAARVDPADLERGRYEFVLLADSAYARFLDPANLKKEHQRLYAERYRQLLALPEVFAVDGGRTRLGPGLSLRRLDLPAVPRAGRAFGASEGLLFGGARLSADGGAVEFTGEEPLAVFKETLAAGRYRIAVEAAGIPPELLRVVDAENHELLADGRPDAVLVLSAPSRVFVCVRLAAGGALVAVRVEPLP